MINKNVKQRRDSIAQFKSGGREDLVATEEEQLNVILKYLPEQLSEEEIQKLVQEGIAAVSAQTGIITPKGFYGLGLWMETNRPFNGDTEVFYDFKTDIFEKFEYLISIENFGNKL